MKTSFFQNKWRGIAVILVLAVAFIMMVPPVHAAEINNSGVVAAGEIVNDDLVLSSDTVRMDGTVNGLLMAFGENVVINGNVNGDLIVFGRAVTISDNAVIDGNIFTAAQNVTMNGRVTGSLLGTSATLVNGTTSSIERNLYYGGYSLTQTAGAKTGKDIRAGVYQAILLGDTGQDAVIYGGAVEVKGKIGRNAEFIVGDPTNTTEPVMPFLPGMGITTTLNPGLRIDPAAVIGGKLVYTSKVNQSNAIEATPAGGIVFHTPVPEKNETNAPTATPQNRQALDLLGGLFGFAGNLISLFLVGALLLWKFPGLLHQN
ncbi:MAG TPA: polymer-forming cytoskeletal protein, partial [Leptolinea sp.]